MAVNRAIEAIQSEAHRLTTVRVLGAIEAADWATLARLAEQLGELAQRGLYHDGLERAKSMATFALHSHTEP